MQTELGDNMFSEAAKTEISTIAVELGVEPAALLAVAKVESNGRAFAMVNGEEMPLIRWEGHYFLRHLPENLRRKAIRAGLASPKVGGVPNPRTQTARYNLLARAVKIHEAAALKSCSWGLGQVMGANAEWIGYANVAALVADAKSGVAGQVRVMAAFIRKNGLVDELRTLNWAAFARQYNGPEYKVNKYDIKMAQAYVEFGGTGQTTSGGSGALRQGDTGEDVRELQVMLRRAGFPLIIDGDFGPATKRSVMAFQQASGLTVDGVAGVNTLAALESIGGVG